MRNFKKIYGDNFVTDNSGRRLIACNNWYFPYVVKEIINNPDKVYTYFRGKKITSDMTEEQAYTTVYGSKDHIMKNIQIMMTMLL